MRPSPARRTTLLALVSGLLAAASLLVAAPSQAEEEPTPLEVLASPQQLDPLIALLAAFPTPYRPYTGTICVSGEPACIEDVIVEMERRLEPLAASCSHDAIFSLAYLRVTQNVKAAADAGYFADRAWLTRLDAVFAQMYFETMDHWTAGETAQLPPAWRIALRATRDRAMTGLGDFLLNMNAHINNDFSYALAQVGLTAADGTSRKADHNAYNARLDSLYHPVFAEETARFDPTFDQYDFGPLDELLVGAIMRGWREMVWRNAEALVNAPNALTRALVRQEITEYSTNQARFIRAFFASPDPTERAEYCAANHG